MQSFLYILFLYLMRPRLNFYCERGEQPSCLPIGAIVIRADRCDSDGVICKSHYLEVSRENKELYNKHNKLVRVHNKLVKNLVACANSKSTLSALRDCVEYMIEKR